MIEVTSKSDWQCGEQHFNYEKKTWQKGQNDRKKPNGQNDQKGTKWLKMTKISSLPIYPCIFNFFGTPCGIDIWERFPWSSETFDPGRAKPPARRPPGKVQVIRWAEKCSNVEHFQVAESGARPEEKLEGVGQEESAAPLPPTSKKVLHYWLLLKGNPLYSVWSCPLSYSPEKQGAAQCRRAFVFVLFYVY